MGRLSGYRYRDIIKRLIQLGFSFSRQALHHHPKHTTDMPEGSLRAILRQTDIHPEHFFYLK
jgi:predicted RNA binding protein YcfA (HicA-like mRNA interferase family)